MLALCLFCIICIFSLTAAAVDYSYTEYSLRAEHLAAYFEAGKLTVQIASYTANSGSVVTNVNLTDYFIDQNGFIWFYNPNLSSDDDLVHKENNQFLCNVYLDLGFDFYIGPQSFAIGTISSYPNTSQAFTNNSKVNFVRGATALYSINSSSISKTYHYEEVLNNFSYFNTFYNRHNGSLPYNYKMRLRSVFNLDGYYGDGAEYFDKLDINFNVTCNNSNVYYIPMFCMYGITVDILDDPGAPSQGTNRIVQQLDQIAGMIESGNATQAQIQSAVSDINLTLTVPTSEQVSIESHIQDLIDNEISDITMYESMFDAAETMFDSYFRDVTLSPIPDDPAKPQDASDLIEPFWNHRIFALFFPFVALCATLSYLIYRYL